MPGSLISFSNLFDGRFSDEGTPVVVDSTGIVRFLNRSFGCTWTPVLDTKSQVMHNNGWVFFRTVKNLCYYGFGVSNMNSAKVSR